MNNLALRYVLADPLLTNHEAVRLSCAGDVATVRRSVPKPVSKKTQIVPPKRPAVVARR